MNTTLEREAEIPMIGPDDLVPASSIDIYAMAIADGPMPHTITVHTPIPSTFTVTVGTAPCDIVIARMPTAIFSASGEMGPIPVWVYANTQIGPRPSTPGVRIIITNAIITANPVLALLADIEVFNTGDTPVRLTTPGGMIEIAGRVKDFPIYAMDQSNYTASDSSGAVPVAICYPSQVIPKHDEPALTAKVNLVLSKVVGTPA